MDLSPDEDAFQGRLLHQAALWDNVELLQELLASGADVNARDEHGRTALHAAALAERSRCLQALVAAGADADVVSDEGTGGKTALHISSERGHVENILNLLRASTSSLHLLDGDGRSALELAESNGHRHAVVALIDAIDAEERERLSQHATLRELCTRGEHAALRAQLAALGPAAGVVVNLTPAGANTLLYVASEAGHTASVSALLAAGADGRAHVVTHYSSLYIAAYHGHADIVNMLLLHFPYSVQQETVEKWLPLHAACIGGHAGIVTTLLEHPYPPAMLQTYTDPTGKWQYRMAFDVNARDVSGQSALYAACSLGHLSVVDALLSFTVRAVPVQDDQPAEPAPATVVSPHRAGISLGIHAIVSKLTGNSKKDSSEHRVCPVRVECGRGADSCVSVAARGGHARLLRRLLRAGADPDAAHDPPTKQEEDRSVRRRSRSASAVPRTSPSPGRYNNDDEAPWTALAIAARAANVQIVEMLLAHGATDPHCRALRECVRHGLTDLVCSLLATKAYPDPENKLNKSLLSESVFSGRDDNSLTYSALCPTTPVMINWRELRCQLAQIRMSWVRAAALRVNNRLSSTGGAALHALTRVDVSNNDLRVLPAEMFTLISLRYLNAAQNKLERLPSPSDPFEDELDSKGRKIKKPKKNRPEVYSAPVLQELYLQDNRLEDIPPALFSLPSLSTLDVSNNKLRALPSEMWTAPALRDLNAALNHLKDLPVHPQHPVAPAPSSPSESPHSSATPSISSQFSFNSKPWSRSPSIEHSESSPNDDVPIIQDRAGNAVWSVPRPAHSWRYSVEPPPPSPPSARRPLASLNLAHNQFSCIPASLACLAPNLTRLNMAYNSLRSMSFVTSYPTSLRQLDLSHNEISCWPSLPQVENFSTTEGDPLACFCISPEGNSGRGRPRSSGSVRSQLLNAACPAKRHLRLETLRTLILANNLLTRIQLTTDDDGNTPAPVPLGEQDDDDEWQGSCSQIRSRLLFPLLSMLDVSCNMLRSLPTGLHLLTNLAVLNISGNKDITELPPTMGLLTRLWNLSASGCSLTDPIKTMLSGGRYRSMDVIGYLRSVLHEAKPYARCKLMLTGVQGIGKTSLLECLRQESAIHHRRKPTEHWAKRMGNKSSRRNMSTVGVDIGTWVYEKQRTTRGPVTFRTWDFGGQQEYYATHQYFLSKRSLYLVVWKVTAGRRGLATAIDWLRSIQARAPGAPVIMVATHYDQVANCNLPESESPECLQRLIRSSIMGAADADKLGLPRVLDSVEVSCSTRHNIRLLADIIYSVAFSVKPAGSKEPLLEQLVPASYLALEECVTSLAAELREPVLRHDDYKRLVTQYMQQRGLRSFRDAAELHQATMFLHENGVLLHYDDATLKELYFLKPQWLCDVLAHVVTVREINPFAANGIMKMEDLAHVLKASPMLARGEEASALGVSLLNKFELALALDQRLLLVPPLLPQHEPSLPQLPLRSRSWSGASRMSSRPWPSGLVAQPDPTRGTDSPTLIQETPTITWSGRAGTALRRLLLVSYVPCGLWPRLVTRLLADQTLAAQAGLVYSPPGEIASDETLQSCLPLPWSWKLWRRGVRLCCGELTLFSLRELGPSCDTLLPHYNVEEPAHEYTDLRLRIKQEGAWCDLDVSSSACIELHLPSQVCVLRRADRSTIAGYQSISLEPNAEVLAKVLALVSDHVDLLLEDWYPSLGTRFVHTSEGRCLITRCVPCPSCLRDLMSPDHHQQPPPAEQAIAQAFRRLEVEGEQRPEEGRRARLSEDSRTSDQDSGVGNESNASSRLGSVEGAVNPPSGRVAFGWTVEECILAACTNSYLHCGRHDVKLRDVAPDTLLLDVEEGKRARWEEITRGAVMGRGAFGTVAAGGWRRGGAGERRVAVKALQPVPPQCHTDVAALQAYKAAVARWERDPLSSACRAYCGVRQELSILSGLRHPHVVPLVAVCAAPLALLLELAPQGALDSILRSYRGCGARVGSRVCRALALQAARALEYLHAKRIVYRDLKSENVLVWSMPSPRDAAAAETTTESLNVHIKLADYGISRLAPLSGTKGFGGTEGYMAPEIMRYNGEEEYNEKVDCFSFGMLLYEILTLRQPFEGHEAVKEAILDGARPALSPRELEYPVALLETLRRCWLGSPSQRPTSAALVCVLSAPDAATLLAAARAATATVAAGTTVKQGVGTDYEWTGWEVWYGGDVGRTHTLLVESTKFTYAHTLRVPNDGNTSVQVTAICRVGGEMWLGDSVGRVFVYSICSCAMLWSCRVREAVGGAASAVSALAELPALRRLALALQCGRLFLVTSSQPEAEGSFVLTELGTATDLACLAVVTTQQGVEVWAGGAGLCVYAVSAGGVSAADSLPVAGRVALLAEGGGRALLYTVPGVCVYGWCTATKQCVSRLDCSKLAPCSESLQTLAVDDQIPTTVTALCIANGSAYIGTAQGCIVVADAATLRPLTVFRPYEANLCAIVPLYPHSGSQGEVLLATLGDGYRPLVDRFAPPQSNNTQNYSGYHCLLWKTHHWLPD